MNLVENLYKAYDKNNIPLIATLEITRKCVNECIHCYLNEISSGFYNGRELTTDEVKNVVDELRKLGVFFLNITGGEPLLRKDIKEIINYVIKRGFVIKLFSSLNVDFEILRELYNIGLRNIDVSLYGSRKIHNFITRRDSFDVTYENIKKSVKLGFKITIKTPVLNVNIRELNYLKDISKEIGCSFSIDPVITPRNDGDRFPKRYSISKKDFLNILEFMDVKRLKKERDNALKKYIPCGALRTVIAIDCYGNILPCLTLPIKIGNIREGKIYEIINHHRAKKIRNILSIEPDKCLKCKYKIFCSRCPGTSYLEGKSVSYIYRDACDIAKEIYKNIY